MPIFEGVEKKIEETTGFVVDKYNLEIIGVCEDCQE